ncbi:MAG: glycogen synthase [Acidobacteriota bacterium]
MTECPTLRLAFAASEMTPLAKTGGLADVVAALPASLARRGHEVKVFLPLYRRLREQGREFEPVVSRLRFDLGSRRVSGRLLELVPSPGPRVFCLDIPSLYDRDALYTGDADEHLRWAAFSRGVLAACQETAWAPDVFHVHDWHLGLLPLQHRLLSSWDRLLAQSRSILTIHNLGYQGTFSSEILNDIGLDDAAQHLHQEQLSAGKIGYLTTGLLHAGLLSTVSETYAREIQEEAQGFGLHQLLRSRSDDLVGIVNGVDYSEWDPRIDSHLPTPYGPDTLVDKLETKRMLLSRLGLTPGDEAPTFGIVARLVQQKGFELFFETLPELLAHRDARLCVLGAGESRYEKFFAGLQSEFRGKVCFYRGYHAGLAHLIEAGSDFFLMPSLYEPCGLNQMYSLRYGTVPIVRKTGGLADTVELYSPSSGEGNGIVFEHFDDNAVRWALRQALEVYSDPEAWDRIRLNGMAADHSWDRRAVDYEALYQRVLA